MKTTHKLYGLLLATSAMLFVSWLGIWNALGAITLFSVFIASSYILLKIIRHRFHNENLFLLAIFLGALLGVYLHTYLLMHNEVASSMHTFVVFVFGLSVISSSAYIITIYVKGGEYLYLKYKHKVESFS